MEKSVVLVKPDGVKRALVGEIISRIEKTGLKLIAMKMVWVDKELVAKHYPEERVELLRGIGEKTLKTYKEYGKDTVKELGTSDPLELGKLVNVWNMEALTAGPVVAMLWEGNHAVDNIRRIVGPTLPVFAPPGTIRGDYSADSPVLANEKKRSVKNLIHASGNLEEAKYEQELWFRADEIHSYTRSDEDTIF